MLVTMFTDASLIAATASGGWAMWAKSERGVVRYSGPLKGRCFNSGEVELKAIANALDVLVRSDVCEPGDQVLVAAGNLQALACVLPPRTVTMCHGMSRAAEMIDQTRLKYQLELRTRHIKAHSGTHEPRLWVHDQCDRRAREAARLLHAERGKGWHHA